MTSPIGTIDEVAALGYDNNDIGTSVVTAVTATAPLASSGGETPNITISTLNTEGYDDVFGDISQGTAAAALVYEALRDTPFKAYYFKNNAKEALMMRFQMPHSWDATAPIYPHLHCSPQVNPAVAQNVHLTGYYCWTNDTTAIPALVGWTPFACDLPIGTSDAYKTFYVNLATVNPTAGLKGSALLLVYVERDGGVGDDTYTTNKVGGTVQANLALISLDIHVKKIRIGSPTPTPI